VDDSLVVSIAKQLRKDPAQVLVSWAVQRGTVVLPKSVTAERIKSNFQGKERVPNLEILQLTVPYRL
jgi:L-glyceraldehyde reductase